MRHHEKRKQKDKVSYNIGWGIAYGIYAGGTLIILFSVMVSFCCKERFLDEGGKAIWS